MKVFISHIHEEGALASALKSELERCFGKQVSIFLAEEIPFGANWFNGIKDALANADIILTLFSSLSTSRPWINIETGYGVMAGKTVVPLCHSGYRKTELPTIYMLLQSVDLADGDDFGRLLDQVAQKTSAQCLLVNRSDAILHWRQRLSETELGASVSREVRSGGARDIETAGVEQAARDLLISYDNESEALAAVKVNGVRAARRQVWLVGATLHFTLGNSKQRLVERLQNGVEVNVLIADPKGLHFEATAYSFGQSKKVLDDEARTTLAGCRAILDSSPSIAAKFDVRLADEIFTAGAYFFDPAESNARMLLVPHMPGQDAAVVPGFVLGAQPGGPIDTYHRIIRDGIWTRATSFQKWLAANPDYKI